MNFLEEIKKLRERALLTQTEFAEIVGVAFSIVNRWEAGKARPNIKAMLKLIQRLDMLWLIRIM